MLSRCDEINAKSLKDVNRLCRGDFIIARIIWNEEKHKFHDHFAVIEDR